MPPRSATAGSAPSTCCSGCSTTPSGAPRASSPTTARPARRSARRSSGSSASASRTSTRTRSPRWASTSTPSASGSSARSGRALWRGAPGAGAARQATAGGRSRRGRRRRSTCRCARRSPAATPSSAPSTCCSGCCARATAWPRGSSARPASRATRSSPRSPATPPPDRPRSPFRPWGSLRTEMARPIIGICTAVERAQWGVWDQDAFLLARSYVRAVQDAGGLVVMIPPDDALHDDPDQALDLLDGLILAGGADIDPEAYGAERHPETKHTVPERDAFEVALARRALDRDIPLLGICRGMQLMNVARGGTLEQHLPESHGHHDHRRVLGTFDDADHDVRLADDSLAHAVAGEDVHATKSHHHQGIGTVGDGLRVTGWAVMDELPEVLEDPTRRFALGVQWHPEADECSGFIAALVQEAAAARAGNGSNGDGDGNGAAPVSGRVRARAAGR